MSRVNFAALNEVFPLFGKNEPTVDENLLDGDNNLYFDEQVDHWRGPGTLKKRQSYENYEPGPPPPSTNNSRSPYLIPRYYKDRYTMRPRRAQEYSICPYCQQPPPSQVDQVRTFPTQYRNDTLTFILVIMLLLALIWMTSSRQAYPTIPSYYYGNYQSPYGMPRNW